MSTKYVLAIAGIENIDNFGIILPGFYSETLNMNVLIHTDPRVSIQKSYLLRNFDHLFANDYEAELNSFNHRSLDKRDVTVLTREDKSTQQFKLQSIYREIGSTLAIAIDTFYNPSFLQSTAMFGGNIPNYLVMKPNNGARGIGHIVVDTTKVSLGKLIESIKRDEPDVIKEKWKDKVHFADGIEKEPNEGLNSLKDQDIIAQAIIDNVHEEFRIILINDGEIVHFQKRERHGSPLFLQATGSVENLDGGDLDIEYLKEYSLELYREVTDAFKKLSQHYGPMLSIDLFTTTDGKWGIFEVSNQYGTNGLGTTKAYSIMKRMVETILVSKLHNSQ